MSNPKERHYWSQLRAAFTAGQWRTEFPARAYNGAPLSWSELFRKFKKHCRGYEDVAVVAEQTRLLALLLSSKYTDDDEDIEVEEEGSGLHGTEGEGGGLRREKLGKLNLEGECILQPERIEEATAGYEVLKGLQSSRFDTIHFTLSYYAYALGNPTDCLAYLSKVPELLQFQNHIPSADSTRSNTTHGLLAPSTYAPSTTSFSGSFASIADSTAPEVRDGRAWAMAETFRSLCLKGMSHELLHPRDPHMALRDYLTTLPLFSALRSEFTPKYWPKSTSSPGNLEFTLFTQLREMWRWVERLLWRAVVLSAKACDIFIDGDRSTIPTTSNSSEAKSSLWTWFGHYTSCSTFWPASFRTQHRSTICALHLRALVLRYGVLASLPAPGMAPVYAPTKKLTSGMTSAPTSRPSTALSNTAPGAPPAPNMASSTFQPQPPTQLTWMHTARSVVQDYRAILNVSTSFPRAGERNVKVEDFVELCVKVWEAGGALGEQVGWVIEVLNWSQRLTFNSSLVLRHLTRLFYLGSAPYLAKKTLFVYIQVVGKAWEASKEGVGEDMDDDARWVETLVFGARMLCAGVGGPGGVSTNVSPGSTGPVQGAPVSDDGTEGIEDVLEARAILEKARTRLDGNDKRLVADVLLAEGIIWGLLGIKGQDPISRPTNFDKAHICLIRSIQTHPTPSAYYHLALSFARRIPGARGIPDTVDSKVDLNFPKGHEHNLSRAIECAGHAVEGSPKDVRYWHLLGLLLSATEKWAAAKEILERGAELDDEGDDSTDVEEGDDDDDSEAQEEDSGQGHGNKESRGGSEDADTVMQLQMEVQTLKVPQTNGAMNNTEFVTPTTPSNSKNRKAIFNGFEVPSANGDALHVSDADTFSSVTSGPTLLLQPNATSLPPASSLRHPSLSLLYPVSPSGSDSSGSSVPLISIDQYLPSTAELFERHLQLRMTQVALMEIVDGPEGAEQGWLEIFSWVAEKRGVGSTTAGGSTPGATSQPRQSLDGTNPRPSVDLGSTNPLINVPSDASPPVSYDQDGDPEKVRNSTSSKRFYLGLGARPSATDASQPAPDSLTAIGITISPATPEVETEVQLHLEKVERAQMPSTESLVNTEEVREKERVKEKEKDKKHPNGFSTLGKQKRSLSIDRDNRGSDTSKSKKVQQILKGSVHKGRAGITAVSKKIGHGVVRNGGLRRSTSSPDFYAALQPTFYQASSIHSRRRLSSIIQSADRTPTDSPPPPPPPSLPSASTQQDYLLRNQRSAKENRLLSDLWLMSAATFRRVGKIEQAKGSIQEAEVKDENNPNVWVQLGLYYVALGLYQHALDTLQKARFISSDDVAATVHLSRLYLDPSVTSKIHSSSNNSSPPSSPPRANSSTSTTGTYNPTCTKSSNSSPDVDLAAGMLTHLTKGPGWDVPEAWYYLAKAYGMQGRKEKERDTLKLALEFSEKRGVRDIGSALGWCI